MTIAATAAAIRARKARDGRSYRTGLKQQPRRTTAGRKSRRSEMIKVAENITMSHRFFHIISNHQYIYVHYRRWCQSVCATVAYTF